jgi:hypothetical protein
MGLDEQRRLAVELFNYTWTLLDRPARDAEDDARMINAAHASRLFWDQVGEPVHHARGEWQIARVYATVGRPEPALHHARRCLAQCTESDLGDFDLACAHEALARVHAPAGDAIESARHLTEAREVAARIDDAHDREFVLADIATVPGSG